MISTTPPPGYWKDARGNLVPDKLVTDLEKERDALVRKIVAQAKETSRQLADFRAATMADIAAFVQMSAEQCCASGGPHEHPWTHLPQRPYDGHRGLQLPGFSCGRSRAA